MKKTAIITAIIMTMTTSTAFAQSELHSDKLWHFASGAGIQGFVQGISGSETLGFWTTTAVAIAKEAFDRSHGHGARFDPYDAAATIAGGLAYIGGTHLIEVNFAPRPGGGMVKVEGQF